MTRIDWTIFAALAVMWGCSFLFIALALESFAPLTLVAVRLSIAAIVLAIILAALRRPMPRSPGRWGAFALLGLVNLALPFALVAWGQTHIGAGLASILNATTPLWGVAIAHVVTSDEKATPLRIIGSLLGLGGVVVMIGGDALKGLGDDLMAQLACLFAAICYAAAGIYGRRFAGWGIGALEVTLGQMACGAAMLLPVALLVDRPWLAPAPSLTAIAAMAGLTLISTVLAYILYFRLITSAGATSALAVTFAIPPVAILLGAAILGEALEAGHVAGALLILAGLLVLDGRLPARVLAGIRRKPAISRPPPE